jgi:release factor glutamine methyltransferase
VPDNDPLIFYRAITAFAAKHLNPNGLLFFEINEAFGKEMQTLLQEFGFSEIELWQDLRGKDRFIKAKRTL